MCLLLHIITRGTPWICLWLLISISVSIGTKTEYQLKIKYIIILYIIIKRWNKIKQHWHTFVIVFYSFPSSSNPRKKEKNKSNIMGEYNVPFEHNTLIFCWLLDIHIKSASILFLLSVFFFLWLINVNNEYLYLKDHVYHDIIEVIFIKILIWN